MKKDPFAVLDTPKARAATPAPAPQPVPVVEQPAAVTDPVKRGRGRPKRSTPRTFVAQTVRLTAAQNRTLKKEAVALDVKLQEIFLEGASLYLHSKGRPPLKND